MGGEVMLRLLLVKKLLRNIGGAAAPPTFTHSIFYSFGRPLVGRSCLLGKVAEATFRYAEERRPQAAFPEMSYLAFLYHSLSSSVQAAPPLAIQFSTKPS